ncbi:interleukin-21 receptor [Austrofundulus limnaeus]|uniref:Interleukin-21 receptor n=1 Tax=Austrofundulus limnaeus TaxID=52670 RepID=A0A2I4CUS0_AUSLI|nr:PREDICTED: interleukin-21 receptor-like [Austrofundulus limnaeus]
MALKPVFLLWALTLCVRDAACMCNVTCSTNYINSLNCSCSGSMPALPVTLHVTCSNEDTDVSGSCVLEPPRSWCIIFQEDLFDVTTVGTQCSALSQNQRSAEPAGPFTWALADVVKPEPPFGVRVTKTAESLNITWSSNDSSYPLKYRVRVRTAADFKNQLNFSTNENNIEINPKQLREDVVYVVDVQAKLQAVFLLGPWSEWSSAAEFRTAGTEEMNFLWLCISMPIIGVLLVLLVLGYLQKPCWQKKLRMITYIPRPSEYFKPLYLNHEGNFKEWVKPNFKEYDYLMIDPALQISSEKQSVLHWKNQEQSFDAYETKEGGGFLHTLGNLLQDDSSSQSIAHSTGHISIYTVTLSGEEFEEEVSSQSSLRSYQDGESSFGASDRDQAGYRLEIVSVRSRQSRISLQSQARIVNDSSMENLNYEADAPFNVAERVSLNSFVSNEQSDDGYPRVDLDTIDSGFGECGSPGASDSNPVEQMDSFHEHNHSNYVRQWNICRTILEDPSNTNNELHEKL